MNFFIFSLPRSGSAWLSVFLSGRDSFCYHEPLASAGVDLQSLRARRPESAVGAIDTVAYVSNKTVKAHLPDCRFYALRRNASDIQASANRLGIKYDARKEAARFAVQTDGLPIIEYRKLGQLGYLEAVWALVIGQQNFDGERAMLLKEMNIQRDIKAMAKRLPALKAMLP